MADDLVSSSSGVIASTNYRTRDVGATGKHAFKGDLAPWVATPLTGAQVLTVSSTAVALTVPTGATHAMLSVEGNPVRFYNSGDTPTSLAGHFLAAGFGPLEIDRLSSVKLIRQGSADATVQVSYHKYV